MSISHIVLHEAAIDVGFSSTKFTYGPGTDRSGTVILADLFPSLAVQTSDAHGTNKSEKLGGAAPDGVTVEVDGAQYFVGKSALQASSGVGSTRLAFAGYSNTPQYKAIRTVGIGSYSASEILAYDAWGQQSGALLLLADHHVNDALAIHFRLQFQSVTRGDCMLSTFATHPITVGVNPIFYGAGSRVCDYRVTYCPDYEKGVSRECTTRSEQSWA